MRNVIKSDFNSYDKLEVPDDVALLDYLVKSQVFPFRLHKVSELNFSRLLNSHEVLTEGKRKLMAGYSMLPDTDMYITGGLRLSDPSLKVQGSFLVRSDEIIYSPFLPFFWNERRSYMYGGENYYTTLSYQELLRELLVTKRTLLLHYGKDEMFSPLLKNVSISDMEDFMKYPKMGKEIMIREKQLHIKHS